MIHGRGATVIAATLLWLACAGAVRAQDAATDVPPADRWTFVVAPYLWAISLDGNAEVRGVEADIDVPFSDAVKDLSLGAMLLVDARRGRFGIAANGVFTRVSPEDEIGPLEIDVTTDLAQLGFGPYYRAVEWRYGESASGRPLRLVLEPWVGARLNHLRLELDLSPGPQVDDSQTWVDPVIGTRFAVDLAERRIVAGEADVGGVVAGSDLSWNAQGYLGYRTSVFGQPTTFAIGYRALYVDYDHNDFKLSTFLISRSAIDERPEERAPHEVTLDGFWIDRHEVTNAQFARFVEATGYVTTAERGLDPEDHPGVPIELLAPGAVVFTPPDGLLDLVDVSQWWRFVPGADWRHPSGPGSSIEGRDNHSVVNIAYEDAQAYVRWLGRELPSEAQWEFAARGRLDGATYSWGDEYCDPVTGWRANTWQGLFPLNNDADDGYAGTAPVGCFAPNGYGLFDMAGNVWEYARDWYVPEHPPAPTTNPQGPDLALAARYAGPTGPSVVIKGGSYLCAPNFCAGIVPPRASLRTSASVPAISVSERSSTRRPARSADHRVRVEGRSRAQRQPTAMAAGEPRARLRFSRQHPPSLCGS